MSFGSVVWKGLQALVKWIGTNGAFIFKFVKVGSMLGGIALGAWWRIRKATKLKKPTAESVKREEPTIANAHVFETIEDFIDAEPEMDRIAKAKLGKKRFKELKRRRREILDNNWNSLTEQFAAEKANRQKEEKRRREIEERKRAERREKARKEQARIKAIHAEHEAEQQAEYDKNYKILLKNIDAPRPLKAPVKYTWTAEELLENNHGHALRPAAIPSMPTTKYLALELALYGPWKERDIHRYFKNWKDPARRKRIIADYLGAGSDSPWEYMDHEELPHMWPFVLFPDEEIRLNEELIAFDTYCMQFAII